MTSSSYRVYKIDQEIIKVFHKYVFGYPYEICANLKKTDSGSLIPHNIFKGKLEEYDEGKWRGTCSHGEYSSNILHTHPPSSYSYPSTEDIMKVIKKYGKIINSLIGTKWGVWVISNTTTSNIYSASQEKILFSKIKKHLDTIGLATRTTDKEREGISGAFDKSRDLSDDDFLLVKEENKKLSDLLMIKIELYRWDDILRTGLDIKGLTDIDTKN